MNDSEHSASLERTFEKIIDEKSVSGVIFAFADILNNILVILVTIIIGTKCWLLKFTRTALHAHFCTLGIVFCLSEALMLRNKHNVFTSDYLASTKRILHIVITLVGCGMTVSGTIRKFSGREKHFVTLHGRLGVIACTMYTINLAMGLCAVITDTDHITMQMVHTIIGVTAYFIGILAEGTGYNTGFFHRNFYCIRSFRFVTAIIFFITAKDSMILFLLHIGVYWDHVFYGSS